MKAPEFIQTINSFKKTPLEYDVKYWRVEVRKLIEDAEIIMSIKQKQEKAKCYLYKEMGSIDPYYLTAEGYLELKNVCVNRAGIGPVKRAYNALIKYTSSKQAA